MTSFWKSDLQSKLKVKSGFLAVLLKPPVSTVLGLSGERLLKCCAGGCFVFWQILRMFYEKPSDEKQSFSPHRVSSLKEKPNVGHRCTDEEQWRLRGPQFVQAALNQPITVKEKTSAGACLPRGRKGGWRRRGGQVHMKAVEINVVPTSASEHHSVWFSRAVQTSLHLPHYFRRTFNFMFKRFIFQKHVSRYTCYLSLWRRWYINSGVHSRCYCICFKWWSHTDPEEHANVLTLHKPDKCKTMEHPRATFPRAK